MRAPLAPPRLSEPRNVDADAHAVETSWEMDSPDARILSLSAAMSFAPTSSCATGGTGSCHNLRLRRHERTQVPRDGPHVAMRQLEPRFRKRDSELVRVLVEAPGDFLVSRIEPEREIGRQHRRRVMLRRIVRVRDRARARGVLRLPLLRAGRARRSAPTRSANRFSKKLLLHFVGVVVHVTSRPLVMVSPPTPLS